MKPRSLRSMLPVALTCAALALSASALAAVTVYDNPINSRGQMRELKQTSGGKNRCDRSFAKRAKAMRVSVSGQRLCGYRAPVEGDSNAPDLQMTAVGKVLSEGSKAVRKSAYLAVGVRTAGSRGYLLEVRPRGKRFTLSRGPNGGGFPVSGSDNKIGGIGERNTLKLRAFGNSVRAIVNGEKVAQVNDPNANEVDGRRVIFGLGSTRDSSRGPIARFERVSVAVPDP